MKAREIILTWITAVIALFSVTFLLLRPELDAWREREKLIESARGQIRKSEEILARKTLWEQRLHSLRRSVRPLPSGQTPAGYLSRQINDLATRRGVTLSDRQTGEEKSSGGIHILPIRCRWENASTESIRDLLVDSLESDVIFDVTELTILSKGQDQLRGTLTVNCVYSK